MTAALTAKAKGAKVAVASRSWGATSLSTGALDIAYSPALSPEQQGPRTIAEHVMDIIAHRVNHPYGVLELEPVVHGLRTGFALVKDALAQEGLSLGELALENENLGLPSSLGAVVPAATALGSHLGIDFSTPLEGAWGVVQLHGDSHFDAARVAAGVSHDAGNYSGTRPDLRAVPCTFSASESPLAVAKRLDDEREVDALIESLRRGAAGCAGLIIAPVLGLRRHQQVLARLRDALGIPIIEALAHMPSVPGARLQRALDAALLRAGITRLGEVVAPVVEGRRVRAVQTDDGLEINAVSVVLATGRFVTGGVTWDERCEETLFKLPVATEVGLMEEDSPHAVVRESPVESHPLMTAGVMVGPDLRPIRDGRVAFDNLYAAGMVMGGFASRYALCADGVALSSGQIAGTLAVEAA